MDLSLYTFSTWLLPVLFAITLHEAAHGWMAERFGDDTARRLGRITANPLRHIDPVGTVLLPGLLLLAHSPVMFGYAKPVPVNFHNLRPLYPGMFMVALAGPATNLLLAVGCALLLPAPVAGEADWLAANLFHGVLVNSMLMMFNLLPLLPLDGGRILRALMPGKLGQLYAKTERFGMLILLVLIFVPQLGVMDWFSAVVSRAIVLLLSFTGHEAHLGLTV